MAKVERSYQSTSIQTPMRRVKTIRYWLFGLGLLIQITSNSQPTEPLQPSYYTELPLGSIKPDGWLRRQLTVMATGSTGHLDEVYDKVKNENGWLGGNGDGWEETPYWLDGALPLAYLLDDENLRKKLLRYINWTIDHQRPSGYFGPVTAWEKQTGKQITALDCGNGEDWWPKMIMLKVLQQYYTATGDKRVITLMSRYFRYQWQTLQQCPIKKWSEWANSRGHDNAMMVQWLYQQTKEAFLPRLAALIMTQTFPWSQWLANRDWVINAAVNQNNDFWMARHGVNVAMALKTPAIEFQRTGDSSYLAGLKTGFHDLMTLHGLPMGIFSADEDLHGNSPVQGTELCAIVEAMYSLEKIVEITGDPYYMDALERMTFNALPTQTTDDYNNKQYYQVANQVHIKKGVFNFSLPFNREMNNVLGMRSGYTCCLANMHQGWTKFTTHLWYATADQGIAALHFAPNTLTTRVGKNRQEVTIREETTYPFDGRLKFRFTTAVSTTFPFQLRIPAWCKEATLYLNGQLLQKAGGAQVVKLNRQWKNGDELSVDFPMEIMTSNWGRNSRAIERGPLVYALKLKENWVQKEDEKDGAYYEVYTPDAWNYGVLQEVVKDPAKQIRVVQTQPVTENFSWNLAQAPIELELPAKKIPAWIVSDDVAPQPVTARDGVYMGKTGTDIENIHLIPYGCTKLRIVAFPVVQ